MISSDTDWKKPDEVIVAVRTLMMLLLVCGYRTVKTNFRVCVISPGDMTGFQRRCREYPSFTKNVNFFWFLHWSKRQLIEHAMFHLTGVF